MDYVQEFSSAAKKTIEHLKEELQTVRTGRPSSALLEGMTIDAYGGTAKMKLLEMASIAAEGSTMLSITPYDVSTTHDIEKAILKSPLGLTPKVQGSKIMIIFPSLSSEQRDKFVKLVGQMVEEHRTSIRGIRDDVRKKIKQALDLKAITEDDKFRLEKDIDTNNQKLNDEIQEMRDKKEEQIKAI